MMMEKYVVETSLGLAVSILAKSDANFSNLGSPSSACNSKLYHTELEGLFKPV